MMFRLGDDGVVSSVNEEELVYVDKKELEEFIDSYQQLEKENEQLKQVINDYGSSDVSSCMNTIFKLAKENEQLKEALREELQDNGNSYYIEVFDELFNLDYDEWNRNERYREYTDWEKILKEKGDNE